MLELKNYQQRTLETLKEYFQLCSKLGNADDAFYQVTRQNYGQGIPYRPVRELPGLPYVCLRLPTGGGKTLVAAYSVAVAARELLQSDHPLVLWLTPSDTIREQTLKALRDRSHPYRQALSAEMGALEVLDVGEALNLQPGTLSSSTTIIVATMQAFRVEKTEGRKVYEQSGSLTGHFSSLEREALRGLETYENGAPKPSLANVLRLHRPLVIVDEAHNARTPLSFDTLARFDPAAIIEFTATPDMRDNPSNVLYTVSAAELKAEGMIKLPIRLETHSDWRATIAAAISMQSQLEAAANRERAETGEYIRPIVLLQAQPRSQQRETLTVETVEAYLFNDARIPKNQVARATGEDREIEGVDLFDPECPIRFIITVQALREGWDCSFAYILCSVAELRAQTAVEQILGRVLRQPRAIEKQEPDLNRAYAYVSSAHFEQAVRSLEDALVENGFERQEAREMLAPIGSNQAQLSGLPMFDAGAAAQPVVIVLRDEVNFTPLTNKVAEKIIWDVSRKTLIIRQTLKAQEAEAILACIPEGEARLAAAQAMRKLVEKEPRRLSVPVLAVQGEGFLEQFEETHILEHDWNLAEKEAKLIPDEYSLPVSEGHVVEIDLNNAGRVQASFVSDLQGKMAFLSRDQDWTDLTLADWLDKQIPHADIPQNRSLSFFQRLIEYLKGSRQMTLVQLVKDRYRLREAAAKLVDGYRKEEHGRSFQRYLSGFEAPLVVSPELVFSYDLNPMSYPHPARSLHPGQHPFQKHYYPVVGDLKPDGEEYDCARFIDRNPLVDAWVRNLERQPQRSFWLQTSTDKFYPDFVCRLTDGRYLVVEYKGEHLWSAADAQEKLAVGKAWEEKSEGKCLFVMPHGGRYEEIEAKLR